MNARMDISARRVFRMSLVVALTLASAYALELEYPYIPPIFAILLTSAPKPPVGLKGLLGLAIVIMLILGIGLALIPMLTYYPATGVLTVAVGVFFSNYLSVNLGKGAVASLLTVGITLISSAGVASFDLAVTLIDAIVIGIVLTIVFQWLVYPWLPEDPAPPSAKAAVVPGREQSSWVALRATLIIMPAFLLALINPAAYASIVMKAVSLGQQASVMHARHAGRELIGSTITGGVAAILLWFALQMAPNLWMFFLWTLLFGVYFASKFFGVIASRYPASFWQYAFVTMLILLGPAVADSASDKDVYQAFFVRLALFLAVTVYAWAAIVALEHLRARRIHPPDASISANAKGSI